MGILGVTRFVCTKKVVFVFICVGFCIFALDFE